MSTYRQVKGYNIKKVSGDPSNVKEGQVWYNSVSGTIKLGHLLESWASGGNLGTTRRYLAGCGTQTAALAAGGQSSSPGLNETANSEEYDGSSWTEGSNLNTARIAVAGFGTQTASVCCGGRTPGDKDAVTT